MKFRFCPKCKYTDIILVAGGEIGMYECKKCGFRGTLFPENEIKLKKQTNKAATYTLGETDTFKKLKEKFND